MARRVSEARSTSTASLVLAICLTLGAVSAAHADGHEGEATEGFSLESVGKEFVGAFLNGKPTVNLRLRWEIADFTGGPPSESSAITLRTAIGYGTAPFYGLSGYAEFENVAALQENYFNGVGANNGRETVIADPEGSEVNQAYGKFDFSVIPGLEGTKTSVTVGRQNVVFDDARFIGNVLWRQNYQTYDAVRFDTDLFVENLKFSYLYVYNVYRIFGDDGALGDGTRDSSMDSHWFNLKYNPLPWLKTTAFAYLIQFDDRRTNPGLAANNSQTYGYRLQATHSLTDKVVLGMLSSFAYQADWERSLVPFAAPGTTNAQRDFETIYIWAEGSLQYKPVAKLTFAFEQLGSDGGDFQFRTPLATLHKFNGFSDALLGGPGANGGPNGLRDYMISIAPKLPFGLGGFVRGHYYTTDQGSDRLGWEIEGVLKRKFGKHVTVLAKWAYFEGNNRGVAPVVPDRYRAWLQTVIAF